MNQAEQIAKLLLEIKAITLNLQQPYKYTSGILSPIYCDNRLILSYPEKRHTIIEAFLNVIESAKLKFDVVAGVATAGIAHAAWIADRLNKPMVYVRSSAKEYGKKNLIEGVVHAGQTALVVEDLISTGGSVLNATAALREQGIKVQDCLAIFTYQLKKSLEQFNQAQVKLHALSDFNTLIPVAIKLNYMSEEEKTRALEWNQDPTNWK